MDKQLSLQLLFFLCQSIGLYIVSRMSIQAISDFLHRIFSSRSTIFWIMTILFLPGTIVHEVSHFLAATTLFLKVRDLQIFPTFEEEQIKLGHVTYEKKDVFRAILVGIAPFFGGVGVFLLFYYFKLFPTNMLVLNIFYGYLIYAISTTMFSSKQDLKDAIYLLPLFLLLFIAVYILDIRIDVVIRNQQFLVFLVNLFKTINTYLFLSICINILIILVFKGVQLLRSSKQ